MNLTLLARKRLVFFAVIFYAFICTIGIFDHFYIYIISDKYFFWMATVMLIIPYIGSSGYGIPNFRLNWWAFLILLFMAIIGFIQPNFKSTEYQYDLFCYLRFFIFVLIGFQREFFTTIKKAMFITLVVGICANIFGLLSAETFVRALVEEKTLAYKMQYMLIPAFYYLFLYDTLTKAERRIVIIAICIYGIEQILFQKRLPTLRVVIYLAFYTYSLTLFGKNGGIKFAEIIQRIGLFIIGIFVVIQLVSIIGFKVDEYFTLLIERFYGKGENVSETLEEDSRWEIGNIFYESLWNSGEIFTGRGLGGIVYDQTFIKDDENGFTYRSAAELGIPTMLLKGGFLLVGLFAIYLVKIGKLYKKVKQNVYLFAAWINVIIWFLFLYPEGFIGNYYNPFEILLAYSIGMLLSFKIKDMKEYEPNPLY